MRKTFLALLALLPFAAEAASFKTMKPEILFEEQIGLTRRDESSGATVTALSTATSFIKLTSTVTLIEGAVAPPSPVSRMIIISNQTGAEVTISHEDNDATAANRFSLAGLEDLIVGVGSSATFLYDHGLSRWVPAGGGGGASDALGLDYTPSVPTDWIDPDPVNGQEALDQLAERTTDNEVATQDAQDDIDNHIADPTDAHAASAVGVTPAGDLAADDVQEGLEELQVEVTAAQDAADDSQADIDAHLIDAIGAHAATAISNTPAGTVAATDVQGAINEVSTDVEDHKNDATNAHAASAVGVTPVGDLAADDVQEGLQELQVEVTAAQDAADDAQADIDAHLIDAIGAHAATAISNTPAGTVAATDVQAAINEVSTDVEDHKSDATNAHAGSAIGNTPAGTVAATDVQAAINEVSTDIEDHKSDATNAHAASAVGNTPAGTVAATDVQAAINEVSTDIEDHKGDTTDAHDASAISNSPSGNLGATDVQGALNELQGDIDNISTASVTKTISQTAHGFSVGNWVYRSSGSYVLADADTDATSEVIGVVSSVINANSFVVTTSGYVSGLSGLTDSTAYFLSQTAGAITSTEPTGYLTISKPVLVADSTTSGYVVQYRGVINGSANGSSGAFIHFQGHAGYGATDTKRAYYTTVTDSAAGQMTYVNGSTNGAIVTIAQPGIYCSFLQHSYTSAGQFAAAIVKNLAAGAATTNAPSVTAFPAGPRLTLAFASGGLDHVIPTSTCMYFGIGDTISQVTNGNSIYDASYHNFMVMKVSGGTGGGATSWIPSTATVNCSSGSTTQLWERMNGDDLEIRGAISCGTAGSGTPSINIGSRTIQASKLSAMATPKAGEWTVLPNGSQSIYAPSQEGHFFYDLSDTNDIFLATHRASKSYTKITNFGSILGSTNTEAMQIDIKVPVQ